MDSKGVTLAASAVHQPFYISVCIFYVGRYYLTPVHLLCEILKPYNAYVIYFYMSFIAMLNEKCLPTLISPTLKLCAVNFSLET